MNIQHPALNNPAKPGNVSPDRAKQAIVVVVRRVECAGCGHEPRPDDVVIAHGRRRDGGGRHRRLIRSWPDLAAQILRRRSMTKRLGLLLLAVAVPAAAVAVVLAWASKFGVI